MRVFISWSGERSEQFAKYLHNLLQMYNFGLEPWLSGPAISYGSRWQRKISEALAGTHVGILCLTEESQTSPWVAFEAGALSKEEGSSVIPLYLDFEAVGSKARYLEQFQHVAGTPDGVLRMIKELSARSSSPKMPAETTMTVLERERDELTRRLQAASADDGDSAKTAAPSRPARDLQFETVIAYLERIDRRVARLESRDAGTPEPEERFPLEGIILAQERPSIMVAGDSFETPSGSWSHLGTGRHRESIEAAIPAVGRIGLANHPFASYAGNGLLVGSNLLMTTRHAAELFCEGVGAQDVRMDSGITAGVEFRAESAASGSVYAEILDVVMIHPYWDVALLRVTDLPDVAPLTLSIASSQELAGTEIVEIGCVFSDPRSDLALQNRIFRGIFNVKWMIPGKVVGEDSVASYGKQVEVLAVDTSTLASSPGAAIVHLETGEVVGLKFASRFLEGAYAVPAYQLARDLRVVDAGVRFAGSVDRTHDWDAHWDEADG